MPYMTKAMRRYYMITEADINFLMTLGFSEPRSIKQAYDLIKYFQDARKDLVNG
jgi:hypothetical protein